MPYQSGAWGPEARERSKRRLKYFRQYHKNQYLDHPEEFKQRSKDNYYCEGRREQLKEAYWKGGRRELLKADYQNKEKLKKQKTE